MHGGCRSALGITGMSTESLVLPPHFYLVGGKEDNTLGECRIDAAGSREMGKRRRGFYEGME